MSRFHKVNFYLNLSCCLLNEIRNATQLPRLRLTEARQAGRPIPVPAHGHQTELEIWFDFGGYNYAAPPGLVFRPLYFIAG